MTVLTEVEQRGSGRWTSARLMVVGVAVVALGAVLGGCGDDGGGGGNGESAEETTGVQAGARSEVGQACGTGAEDEAAVSALPAAMLAGQTEGVEAIQAVLQFGDEDIVVDYVNATAERAESGGFPSAAARTDSVEVLDDRGAVFGYTLLIGDAMSEIPVGDGFAVCVDGEWKFSLDTFCNLTGQLPPGCPTPVSDLAAEGLTAEQYKLLSAK